MVPTSACMKERTSLENLQANCWWTEQWEDADLFLFRKMHLHGEKKKKKKKSKQTKPQQKPMRLIKQQGNIMI